MDTLDRIKKLANQKGWSLQKVAEKAGIGINSIYRWNTKVPSTQSLSKVAKVLGVTTDYLLGNTDDPKPLKNLSVDEAVDNLRPYQGQPISEDQKEVIKDLIKGYLDRRNK